MQLLQGAGASSQAWAELVVPEGLGLDCGAYKWRQDQAHVEVFVLLPLAAAPRQVRGSVRAPAPAALCRGIHTATQLWQLPDASPVVRRILTAQRRHPDRYAAVCCRRYMWS